MKQTIVYIGIDVAKAHLDVAWQKRLRRFDNDKAGRVTLVRWIKQKQSGPVQLDLRSQWRLRARLARRAG